MGALTAFITSKLSSGLIVIIGLVAVVVSIVAVPVAVVQTVRLDGVHVLGFALVDGALDKEAKAEAARDAALKNYGTCQANEVKLSGTIDDQNKSIAGLKKAADDATGRANAALDKLHADDAKYQALLASIRGTKVDTSSCPAALLSLGTMIGKGVQ